MPLKLDLSGAGQTLRHTWERLSKLPGGKRLFDRLLGLANPYTGSIDPHFLELGPGHVKVAMQDRRAVRNHVSSVHAIALANLGEMSTGLALMAGLPDDARAIITRLELDYLKKARGELVAECRCTPPTSSQRQEVECRSEIRDRDGQVVARARAVWLVGPKRRAPDGARLA
jgi:acyl-coenzyme A thioesterase PaaI-like protein